MHKVIENLRVDEEIYINRIVKNTSVEGFGNRYCIWVQGCSIHCPNCSNKEMWDKRSGEIYDVNFIINDILKQGDTIEGITFLGGEPFEQAKSLAIISEKARKRGYSIITFTGYTYSFLKNSSDSSINKLIKNTDLLIDGPFKSEELDFSRPWVGSSNQQYIFLTDRYNKNELKGIKNKFEVHVEENGRLIINGMGNYKKLIKLLERKI